MVSPRMRVIIDNDFSGDPDGLVQLTHHLLSPSVEIAAIIGSHLRAGDPFDSSEVTAANAVSRIHEVVDALGQRGRHRVRQGSNTALASSGEPIRSEGALAIVEEAMRDDTTLPLYLAFGAGLTELASAWLIEPRIAERLTLVWIGGVEDPAVAVPPPGASGVEYNLNIDPSRRVSSSTIRTSLSGRCREPPTARRFCRPRSSSHVSVRMERSATCSRLRSDASPRWVRYTGSRSARPTSWVTARSCC